MSIMWHVKHNPRMGEWRVYDENWYYVAGYKTHREALAYADRMSRTVVVELPRVYRSGAINHKDLGHDQGVMINSGDTDVVIRTITGDATIHNKNLKPLAEHLLALHYEKENK